MTTQQPDRAIDIGQYWRMVSRRKGVIFLCTITTVIAAAVALLFVPKVYESQVTFMIDDTQALSADVRRVVGGVIEAPPTGFKPDEQRLGKIVGRIRSRPFLEKVVHLLKMNEDPVVRARAQEKASRQPGMSVDEIAVRMLVSDLQSRISFSYPGSGLYTVSVADFSADNAQLLAKWISQVFVDVYSQGSIDRLRLAHEFGVEQTRIYEDQLRKSEEALRDFKKSVIERAQVKQMVRSDNLMLAEQLYDQLASDVAAAHTRLMACTDSLADRRISFNPASVAALPEVRELTTRLASSSKEGVLSGVAAVGAGGRWPPGGDYPALRDWLEAAIDTGVRNAYPEYGAEAVRISASLTFAQVELGIAQQAAALLASAISSCKQQAQSTPQDEIDQARLETEVARNRELLQSFRSQLVASDISQAVEVTNLGLKLEILDPAALPLGPSRPDKARILLAALFLGPLLGVGLAVFGETMDTTLWTLEDFEKLTPDPILGVTPLLSCLPDRRRWLRRHWVPVSVVGLLLLAGVIVVARTTVLDRIMTSGRPVRMESPER
jgi:uncharacterized protein involved in exopolysaccharide biosynthesis